MAKASVKTKNKSGKKTSKKNVFKKPSQEGKELEVIFSNRCTNYIDFLDKSLKNKQELSSYDQTHKNINDIENTINLVSNNIQMTMNNIIDQVEKQVVNLKNSIIAIDQILPENDTSLKESAVILYNTKRENFLDQFKNNRTAAQSDIGRDILRCHLTAGQGNTDSIVGVFPLFPLGSYEQEEAKEHIKVVKSLSMMAQNYIFHTFFELDIPKLAFKATESGAVSLKQYSDLLDNTDYSNIDYWAKIYKDSYFYSQIEKLDIDLKRRISFIANPFIGNTETLIKYCADNVHTNKDVIDSANYISPLAFMAKKLISNYDKLGWCGGLFGLINTKHEISEYKNKNPEKRAKGISFGKNMGYRYGLTLYKNTLEELNELIKLGITPLTSEFIKSEGKEYLSFPEAQTIITLPDIPEKDKDKYRDDITEEEFKELDPETQKQVKAYAKMKQMQYLGNCLIEDTINKGIMLILRNYIGKVGKPDDLKSLLSSRVEEYMTIFRGKPGHNSEPFTTYEPAIEDYHIEKIMVAGQTAYCTIRILPAAVLRKFELATILSTWSFESKSDPNKIRESQPENS